jgi:hypothetical protein
MVPDGEVKDVRHLAPRSVPVGAFEFLEVLQNQYRVMAWRLSVLSHYMCDGPL